MLSPKVKVLTEDAVRIVKPRGEFIGGKETDELRDALAKEAEQGTDRLLIDLEDVTYLNSSALGVLIAAHTNFTKREAKLGLSNVSKNIENIFVITKLAVVFNIYDDQSEGLKALQGE